MSELDESKNPISGLKCPLCKISFERDQYLRVMGEESSFTDSKTHTRVIRLRCGHCGYDIKRTVTTPINTENPSNVKSK